MFQSAQYPTASQIDHHIRSQKMTVRGLDEPGNICGGQIHSQNKGLLDQAVQVRAEFANVNVVLLQGDMA